jgi:hypothetical protein
LCKTSVTSCLPDIEFQLTRLTFQIVVVCSGAEQLGNFVQADNLAGLQCHEPPYMQPFEQVAQI